MTTQTADRSHIGFYREAWLVVAQGGWWKLREIIEQIPSGVEVEQPHCQMWIMARRYGYFVTRGGKGATEYAVTPECMVPRGITVQRLNEALCFKPGKELVAHG